MDAKAVKQPKRRRSETAASTKLASFASFLASYALVRSETHTYDIGANDKEPHVENQVLYQPEFTRTYGPVDARRSGSDLPNRGA